MKPADKQHAYDVRFYKFLRGIISVSAIASESRYTLSRTRLCTRPSRAPSVKNVTADIIA